MFSVCFVVCLVKHERNKRSKTKWNYTLDTGIIAVCTLCVCMRVCACECCTRTAWIIIFAFFFCTFRLTPIFNVVGDCVFGCEPIKHTCAFVRTQRVPSVCHQYISNATYTWNTERFESNEPISNHRHDGERSLQIERSTLLNVKATVDEMGHASYLAYMGINESVHCSRSSRSAAYFWGNCIHT